MRLVQVYAADKAQKVVVRPDPDNTIKLNNRDQGNSNPVIAKSLQKWQLLRLVYG